MAVTSRVLRVGDALVALVRSLCSDAGRPDAEVTRTYHARRFDAAKTVGLKVYVVPREDDVVLGGDGGDRSRDPLDCRFNVVFAERCPKDWQTWDEKDAWVDGLVDLVTGVRDRLADARDYADLGGLVCVPVETGERVVADIAELNENGVFVSEFTNTVREE